MNLYYIQFHNLPPLYALGESLQAAVEAARAELTPQIKPTPLLGFAPKEPKPPILVRVELIADAAGTSGVRLIDTRPGCIPPANGA